MEPWEQEAAALRALRADWAGVKVSLALRRLQRELKFEGQNRTPDGRYDFGRQAGGKTGAAKRAALGAAARAMVAHPEAAAGVAQAAGLPLAAGVVGVSRAAGLANHAATGQGMTPILHIPFDSPLTMGRMSARSPSEQARIVRECDDAYEEDLKECSRLAPSGRLSGYPRNQAYVVCEHQAMERYSECLSYGGTAGIRSPLFTLGKGH